MKPTRVTCEGISFADVPSLPEINAVFTACRAGPDCNVVDVVDFAGKRITRWTLPRTVFPAAVERLRARLPADDLPFAPITHEDFCRSILARPHATHLSRDGKLFVCMSDSHSGLCVPVIDTRSRQAWLFDEDCDEDLKCYSATGSFGPGGNTWMYVRWPFADALGSYGREIVRTECEIGRIETGSLESRAISSVKMPDRIHQITCSSTGRYAVMAPFRWDLNVLYPAASMQDDPAGYRRAHDAGFRTHDVTTVDLATGAHWNTPVPLAVLAHMEFDPLAPDTFYLSAHNMCQVKQGVILEGPAALFKLRIANGRTTIDARYSDDRFFRIRQHVPFVHRGRTLLAVTNFPNSLDLLDAATMTLWRRVELFPASGLDFSATGNVLCPDYPETCFYVNASDDGRYLVLGCSRHFNLYDIEEDRVLDTRVPLHLPPGFADVGHSRSLGT